MKYGIVLVVYIGLWSNSFVQAEDRKDVKWDIEFYRKKAKDCRDKNLIKKNTVTDLAVMSGALFAGCGCIATSKKEAAPALLLGALSAGCIGVGLAIEWAAYHYLFKPSLEWFYQLDSLEPNEFATEGITIGGKTYQVSKYFDNLKNLYGDKGYRLYFMPKDEYIADVYHLIIDALKENEKAKAAVAFVSIRTTPGVSYAHGKPLGRIIVGLKPTVERDEANNVAKFLIEKTMQYPSIRINPRYAKAFELNLLHIMHSVSSLGALSAYSDFLGNLVYAAYGSDDYKESVKSEPENGFMRKKGILSGLTHSMKVLIGTCKK